VADIEGGNDRTGERGFVVMPPADLVAVVRTAAVPDIPYAALADVLEPVRDADQGVVDWVLTSELFERRRAAGDLVAGYWAWRSRWEQRIGLGPVSNAVALVRHTRRLAGAGPGPLDDLLPLERLVAGQDVDIVIDLDHHWDALEEARQLVVRAGGIGLGFVDETRDGAVGFARTWPPVGGEQLLAASSEVSVIAGPGPELRVELRDQDGERATTVERVDLTGEDTVVTSPTGETLRIAGPSARPLAWVVPGSARWRVRTVDLVVVWAELFAGMLGALSVAAEHGGLIRLTTASPLRR